MKRHPFYQEQERARVFLRKFIQQQQKAQWNFINNPGVTPVPTPANWIYSGYSGFTATLANSSTAVTVVNIGTSMLAIGQVVTGAGIVNNPPTTIAGIPSATTLTLSQNTTASAAGAGVALTFQGVPGLQSAQFSSYPFFAVPNPAAPDIPGNTFYIPEQQILNAGVSFIPANGYGFMSLGQMATTASTIQLQTAAGTWTTIYTGLTTGAAFSPCYNFDGANLRVTAGTGALTGQSYIFYRYRSQTTY